MSAALARFACMIFAALPILDANAQTLHFVTETFPPFNYQENGAAAGPMVRIVQSVCAQMKATCKIEPLPWRRAMLFVERGDADGIFSILKVPERTKVFYFTTPVIGTSYAIYARDDNKFVYRGKQDFAGHTVGVYGPSGTSITLADLLESVQGTRTIVEIDNLTVLRLLSAGGYGDDGLAFANRDVADFMIRQAGIKNLRRIADARKVQYCIAFSKVSVRESLFRRFDETLTSQIKNGTVKAILDKYDLRPAD